MLPTISLAGLDAFFRRQLRIPEAQSTKAEVWVQSLRPAYFVDALPDAAVPVCVGFREAGVVVTKKLCDLRNRVGGVEKCGCDAENEWPVRDEDHSGFCMEAG